MTFFSKDLPFALPFLAGALICNMVEKISIAAATEKHIPQITALVNAAYRGDTSKKGWTTEAHLLEGIRTDEGSIKSMLQKKEATILICTNDKNEMLGCVYLEKQKEEMYLGMLSVDPQLQAKGIGKKLLAASEAYAANSGTTAIVMSVISVRKELIDWYLRHGYRITGDKKPFPRDPRFGIPKQFLEFIVLKKTLPAKEK
jgi:ribosomal protein S18 acetylase RimI-like enzyme